MHGLIMGRPAQNNPNLGLGTHRKQGVNTAQEADGIKLAPHHVIGTFDYLGDPPAAHESDALCNVMGFESRAKVLRLVDLSLAFNVDEYEFDGILACRIQPLVIPIARNHVVASQTEHLVADGPKDLLGGNVQNRGLLQRTGLI
jgi:hypothetical protein